MYLVAMIKKVVDDFRSNMEYFHPCFDFRLSIGLRNAEVFGIACYYVQINGSFDHEFAEREGSATHQRLWSVTQTVKARVVPLSQQIVEDLNQYRKTIQ